MSFADLPTKPASTGRRPRVVVLALFGILIAAAASRWLGGVRLPDAGGDTLRLALLSGTATVVGEDGRVVEARPGDLPALAPGDEVATGGGSVARLGVGRAGAVEADELTRLLVLGFRPGAVGRGPQIDLGLLRGTLRATTEEASFGGTRVLVETNVLTVEVQGGALICEALAADHTRVAVERGRATVSMGEQTVELVRGQFVDAWLGGPLEPSGTPQPEASDGAGTATPAGWDYWDESNKTLFPPIVTPTRPGDAPVEGTPAAPEVTAVPGGLYVVGPGDTLFSIARRYGISWEALWEANRDELAKPELLQVGQVLRIPE